MYTIYIFFIFFFFSSRRRHTRFDCDWSSDVCSSDLEEEAEVRGGRDRLGHDRDEEAPVPARLEAEACSQIVEMLLEPPPLVGDGAPGQPAETARQEPHPDPCRVEVDGADHAIGSHKRLRLRAMRLHPSRSVKIRRGSRAPAVRIARGANGRMPSAAGAWRAGARSSRPAEGDRLRGSGSSGTA